MTKSSLRAACKICARFGRNNCSQLKQPGSNIIVCLKIDSCSDAIIFCLHNHVCALIVCIVCDLQTPTKMSESGCLTCPAHFATYWQRIPDSLISFAKASPAWHQDSFTAQSWCLICVHGLLMLLPRQVQQDVCIAVSLCGSSFLLTCLNNIELCLGIAPVTLGFFAHFRTNPNSLRSTETYKRKRVVWYSQDIQNGGKNSWRRNLEVPVYMLTVGWARANLVITI